MADDNPIVNDWKNDGKEFVDDMHKQAEKQFGTSEETQGTEKSGQ